MAKKEKQSETSKLKEKLLIQKKNAVIKLSDEEIAECDKFCVFQSR